MTPRLTVAFVILVAASWWNAPSVFGRRAGIRRASARPFHARTGGSLLFVRGVRSGPVLLIERSCSASTPIRVCRGFWACPAICADLRVASDLDGDGVLTGATTACGFRIPIRPRRRRFSGRPLRYLSVDSQPSQDDATETGAARMRQLSGAGKRGAERSRRRRRGGPVRLDDGELSLRWTPLRSGVGRRGGTRCLECVLGLLEPAPVQGRYTEGPLACGLTVPQWKTGLDCRPRRRTRTSSAACGRDGRRGSARTARETRDPTRSLSIAA